MGEVAINHELHGLHAVMGKDGFKRVFWTGAGWTDQARGALTYRGNHDAMTTANRLRNHLGYSRRFMPISVIRAPRTYQHLNHR